MGTGRPRQKSSHSATWSEPERNTRTGGEGWSLRNFYTSGGREKFLKHGDQVEILTLESFVAKANA